VLVLQYEQCCRDRDGQLAATYRFLGLDDAHRPDSLQTAVNVSSTKRPLDPEAGRRLADLYAADLADLYSLLPHLDRSLWPSAEGVGS
jgi:hypothetical protein